METIQAWLEVAKAEIETIKQYLALRTDEMTMLPEINADEFNHCLIALFNATILLGIKIPTDSLDELIEQVFETPEE